jgi:hypothetical protein
MSNGEGKSITLDLLYTKEVESSQKELQERGKKVAFSFARSHLSMLVRSKPLEI